MKTEVAVTNRKTWAALLLAFIAALCMAGAVSAAESPVVQRMRVDAVRELRPFRNTPVRLRVRASQMAGRVARMRVRAPAHVARDFRVLEFELRDVARSGDLSRMERKVGYYRPDRRDDRHEKHPPRGRDRDDGRRGDNRRDDDDRRRDEDRRRNDGDRGRRDRNDDRRNDRGRGR